MSEQDPRKPASTLANLPAQQIDTSARELRTKLMQVGSPEALAKSAPEASGEQGQDEILFKVEAYATASFLIEQLWDFIQKSNQNDPLLFRTRLDEHRAGRERSPAVFVDSFNKTLDTYHESFFDNVHERLQAQSKGQMSKEDTLVLRFVSAHRVLNPATKQIPIPSMKDLISFFGRMAEVIPRVAERDLGRELSVTELHDMLKNQSIKIFFMQMMSNSRPVLMPIIATLEEGGIPDIDNPEGTFKDRYFKVQKGQGGTPYVALDPEVVSRFRNAIESLAEKWARDGKKPIRALQCPALYTGKFAEMFDWVASEFKEFTKV